MNEKTDLGKIKGNLNKAELKLLNMADPVAVSSAMKNTTPEDIIEMVNRVFAMEFDQENSKKTMSDQDKAIMLAEKLRRIRAKNKANPMGKKDGGVVKNLTRAVMQKLMEKFQTNSKVFLNYQKKFNKK